LKSCSSVMMVLYWRVVRVSWWCYIEELFERHGVKLKSCLSVMVLYEELFECHDNVVLKSCSSVMMVLYWRVVWASWCYIEELFECHDGVILKSCLSVMVLNGRVVRVSWCYIEELFECHDGVILKSCSSVMVLYWMVVLSVIVSFWRVFCICQCRSVWACHNKI